MSTWTLAVAGAVVASFLISAIWYAAWGRTLGRLDAAYTADNARPPLTTALIESVRNLVLVVVMARLVVLTDVAGLGDGIVLGLTMWVGFPVVILAGSVFHERVPAALAAIHAGDWLLKLLAVTAVLTLAR